MKTLSKKYQSLKIDLAILFQTLQENPIQGITLGINCYEIRLAIALKGKGKSSGSRIITNIDIAD